MPSMTITTDNGQATRLAAAVGSFMELGRAANAAEIKQFTIDRLREFVLDYERREDMKAVQGGRGAFTPS